MGLGLGSAGVGISDAFQRQVQRRLEEELAREQLAQEDRKIASLEQLQRAQQAKAEADAGFTNFRGEAGRELIGSLGGGQQPSPVSDTTAAVVGQRGSSPDVLEGVSSGPPTMEPTFRSEITETRPDSIDLENSNPFNIRDRALAQISGFQATPIFGPGGPPHAVEMGRKAEAQRQQQDIANENIPVEHRIREGIGDVPLTTRPRFDSDTGTNVFDVGSQAGFVRDANAAGGTQTFRSPVPNAQIETLQQGTLINNIIQGVAPKVDQLIEQGLVGPVAGRFSRFRQERLPETMGGLNNKVLREVLTQEGLLLSTTINKFSGAAASEAEVARITKFLPSIEKKADSWHVDAQITIDNNMILDEAIRMGVPLEQYLLATGNELGGASAEAASTPEGAGVNPAVGFRRLPGR